MSRESRRRFGLWALIVAGVVFGALLLALGVTLVIFDRAIDSSTTGRVLDYSEIFGDPDSATVEFFVGDRRVIADVGVSRRLDRGERVVIEYDADDPEFARVAGDHTDRNFALLETALGAAMLGSVVWAWARRRRTVKRERASAVDAGSRHVAG